MTHHITRPHGNQRWILQAGAVVGYTRPLDVKLRVEGGYAYAVGAPGHRLIVYACGGEVVGVAESPAHALLMFIRSQEEG